MPEPRMEEIGKIALFFAKPSAAVVELTAPLRVGETIYVKGHTTDFHQIVESMQCDRQPIQAASAGQSVGIQMKDRCRKHDVVYKLVGTPQSAQNSDRNTEFHRDTEALPSSTSLCFCGLLWASVV